MADFFHKIVSFTATYDPLTALLLLAWCLVGEIGWTIPYVLESFWLLVGFNAGAGLISPWYIIMLWIAAQIGRQIGNIGLYFIARLGVPVLAEFFHKIHLDRFFNKIKLRTGAAQRIDIASPFSVACGRMVGMRIPCLLVMAAKKKPGMLALGVVLQSLVWDALYISLGAIFGATVKIEPVYMLLISLGCITMMYIITYFIKKLVNQFRKTPVPRVVVLPRTDTEVPDLS